MSPSALFRRDFDFDSPMKDATSQDSLDNTTTDQMIFGPLDFDDQYSSSASLWDSYNDFSSSHPAPSSIQFDFSVPSPSSTTDTYHDPSIFPTLGEVQSTLPDFDDNSFYFSHWLNDQPDLPALDNSSSPIPIHPTLSDPQTPQSFVPYIEHRPFPQSASFSPSEFAALHPLPRSVSPSVALEHTKQPRAPRIDSASPPAVLVHPPAWTSDLWDTSPYLRTASPRPPAFHPPLSENPSTSRRTRFPFRREPTPVGQSFQSSSAPSLLHIHPPSLARTYSHRAESSIATEDRDATIRRKKRLSAPEHPRVTEKTTDNALSKSLLRPPKLAPSAWQLYFTDWIQRQQASSTRKLNVAQAAKEAGQEYAGLSPEEKEPYKRRSQAAKEARERELAAYMRTLTPDDIKRENAFRTAQRKAGKSRKSNIKDPNAPKKPLSAYFMFLQRIRSNPALVEEVFGDETETTKQSVLAAAKWRSMADDERKPFLAQAEQEKLDYEAARRLYEEGTTGLGTNINFSIFPGSPAETVFRASLPRPVAKTESFSSESESEGFTTDDGLDQYIRS